MKKFFQRYYRHQKQPPNTKTKKNCEFHEWYIGKFFNTYIYYISISFPVNPYISVALRHHFSCCQKFHLIRRTIVNFFCHYFLCIEILFIVWPVWHRESHFTFAYNLDEISVIIMWLLCWLGNHWTSWILWLQF